MSGYAILGATKSSPRSAALHGLGWLGGGILLYRMWPGYPVLKFFLGSTLGWNVVTLVTGDDGSVR